MLGWHGNTQGYLASSLFLSSIILFPPFPSLPPSFPSFPPSLQGIFPHAVSSPGGHPHTRPAQPGGGRVGGREREGDLCTLPQLHSAPSIQSEAIPESLKNMLLVMSTQGVLDVSINTSQSDVSTTPNKVSPLELTM